MTYYYYYYYHYYLWNICVENMKWYISPLVTVCINVFSKHQYFNWQQAVYPQNAMDNMILQRWTMALIYMIHVYELILTSSVVEKFQKLSAELVIDVVCFDVACCDATTTIYIYIMIIIMLHLYSANLKNGEKSPCSKALLSRKHWKESQTIYSYNIRFSGSRDTPH